MNIIRCTVDSIKGALSIIIEKYGSSVSYLKETDDEGKKKYFRIIL